MPDVAASSSARRADATSTAAEPPPPAAAIRAFGLINGLGLWTLYVKEVRRFMKVAVQTVLAPIVQTLLFMLVFSLAWGATRGETLGAPYTHFLAPGLVMMAILGGAFQNASSSIIVSKIQGNAVDFLMPPLSAFELTAAFVAGAATRGVLVGFAAWLAVLPFAPVWPAAPWAILYFALAASVMFGAIGTLAGVWADKFDHLAAVTNFVIAPLTFLSGTFYLVDILPAPLETASRWNPVFHLIDGFRYGFLGESDDSIAVAVVSAFALSALFCGAVYVMFRTGWRLKD